MNVWLCKGKDTGVRAPGMEVRLCGRRERLLLDMLGTVTVGSYLSFNSTLLLWVLCLRSKLQGWLQDEL